MSDNTSQNINQMQGEVETLDINDLPEDDEQASDDLAHSLETLQRLIERHANQLDEIKEKMKLHRESMRDIFGNDKELQQAEDQADQVKTQVKQQKQRVQDKPEVQDLKLKLSDLREERKEHKETLDKLLADYYRMTGSTSFDTSDGDQREFKLSAKVKPKRS